ncbi:DUF4339 domain-containing protein [Rubripirellula amarantea]|nr:DUF4339 domain-containing protein [Rubripirellula amarantea]
MTTGFGAPGLAELAIIAVMLVLLIGVPLAFIFAVVKLLDRKPVAGGPPVFPPQGVHIANQSGMRSGPLNEVSLVDQLASGDTLPSDLCWYEGQKDWRPIRSAFPDLCTLIAPPIPAAGPPLPSQAQASVALEHADVFWIGFAVLAVVACFASVAINILSLETGEAASVGLLLSIPIFLAYTVVWAWLHFRLWDSLPQECRATTPAKAVGFLFIPIFNLYWVFLSFVYLADGLDSWASHRNESSAGGLRTLAILCSCVFVGSFLVMASPGLSAVASVADTVVTLLFYNRALKCSKTLVE